MILSWVKRKEGRKKKTQLDGAVRFHRSNIYILKKKIEKRTAYLFTWGYIIYVLS